MAACPANNTTVPLPRSTLCILRTGLPNGQQSWSLALDYCTANFSGGTLCTFQQLHRSCKNGGLQPIAGAWLGDRTADDEAALTNGGNDCNNFDAVGSSLGNQGAAYCCLEWMKY